MSYFERKLGLILEEIGYLNPDSMWDSDYDGYTFIDTTHYIMYGDLGDTHLDIMRENEEYTHDLIREVLVRHPEAFAGEPHELGSRTMQALRSHWIEHYALLGRAAFIKPGADNILGDHIDKALENRGFKTPALLISYWSDYGGDIRVSANKVANKMQVPSNTPVVVTAPGYGLFELNNENAEKKELTPEQQKELDLMRQLHLMNPQQKKAAMKQLGLGSSGKPSAGQRAGLTPGQKYWAMSSEGKPT
jgi:hypothetical protein